MPRKKAAAKKVKISTSRPVGWAITDPARPGWSETGTITSADLKALYGQKGYATATQFKELRRHAVNDVTREIMSNGIKLTWDQADDLGDETLDWMKTRLGLRSATTDSGITFKPVSTQSAGRSHATVARSILSPYEAGRVDGFKGRANRYASRRYLEDAAWKVASKAERAAQIRGGYTPMDHGLTLDPYGNPKMVRMQLAAPGTPEEYKRGYRDGAKERD